MKKVISLITVMCMMLSLVVSLSVYADGSIYRNNTMEPTGSGSNVTSFSLVCSSINTEGGVPTKGQIAAGNIIQSLAGDNTLGVDGSGAASFRVKSYQSTGFMGLVDTNKAGCTVKAGYTYFKSAMMKLNDANTDASNKTKTINMFCEQGGAGFSSKSEDFSATLSSYVSGTEAICTYDWAGAKANTLKYTINSTDWTRVTTSIYRETGSVANDKADRSGWVVWGKDWSTNTWLGNWEILMDDYFILEVPNTDLKAVVMPKAYGVKISSSGKTAGSKLSCTAASSYDVNPLVTPTLTYQWQFSSDDATWMDIKDATGTEYTLTADDADVDNERSFRLAVTATSENSANVKSSSTAYSSVFSISDMPVVKSVSVTGKTFVGEKLSATATVVRSEFVKSYVYKWQQSDDGSTFTDIDGATTNEFTVTSGQKGKFIRCSAYVTSDSYGNSNTAYSPSYKIYDSNETMYLYVDGKTGGTGSIDSPFSTLDQARDAVRTLRTNTINNAVVVYLRGGEYFLDKAFMLTAEDKNITFSAYPGEKVTITGGKHVAQNDITRVTDESVLGRVIDPIARKNLYQIDLSDYYDAIPETADYDYAKDSWDYSKLIDQVQIVVNGTSLLQSRWPNTITEELEIASATGGNNAINTVTYKDDTDRAKLWSKEGLESAMAEGHFVYHWCTGTYNTTDFNPNIKTFKTATATPQQFKSGFRFYFTNILDEIDLPGESYIDTTTKTAYFYGYGDMANPEVVAPVSKINLISSNGAQNITFKDINLEAVRGGAFSIYNGVNITIDNCDIKHFADMNYLFGDNCIIRNCYFYDGSIGGVKVSGGNTNTFAGGHNLIENNKFNNLSTRLLCYGTFLSLYKTTCPTVRGNEFYNAKHNMIGLGGSNDAILENNSIHDGVTWTGDMGAIYWNMYPNGIGNEIRNNYFYNNQSDYGEGWSQSIFWDDTAPGPYVHNNIFYQATRSTSNGGTKFAIKGYGGAYAKATQNIFVDVPYAAQFQTYYPFESDKTQTGWWLTQYGKAANSMNGGSSTEWLWSLLSPVCDSQVYADHYKGTQWEPMLQMFSNDFYNANLKNLDRNNDTGKLLKLAKQYAPKLTNVFDDNIVIKSKDGRGLSDYGNGVENNSYIADSDKLPDGSSMFVDYGKDFQLSAKGLAAVKAQIPGFENIDTSLIGVKSFDNNNKTEFVGGNRPVASNLSVKVTDTVSAKYDFSDADSDNEGLSHFTWYVSNTKDGEYKKLNIGNTGEFASESLMGNYVKFEVTPYDITGLEGEKVMSQPTLVEKYSGSKTTLEQLITKADKLYVEIEEGTGFGQASAADKATFDTAIKAAKAVNSNEEDVLFNACTSLKNAIEAVENATNRTLPAIVTGTKLKILSFMENINIAVPAGIENVSVVLQVGEALHKMVFSGFVSVDGASVPTTLTIDEGTIITGGNATINLFGYSSSTTVTIPNADTAKITALKLSNDTLSLSKPAVIEFSGADKAKLSGYITTRFNSITNIIASADKLGSNKYARIKNDSGVTVAMTELGELVLYSRSQVIIDPPNPGDGGSGGSNGGGGGGGSSGGGGGRGSSTATYSGNNNLPVTPTETKTFADVKGHWAEADILSMCESGIVTGVTENTFEPDRDISRAEFATLIVRALKLSGDAQPQFEDVESGSWYEQSVNLAAKAGLITGSDGLFRPNDCITRQEMAVIIVKAYKYLQKTAEKGSIDSFKDKDSIASWAKDFIEEAVGSGLIKGMDDGTFAPGEKATRAQAASIIKRLL